MTAIEMKYSLFRDIDSISDETLLRKLNEFVKSLLRISKEESVAAEDKCEIPEFVRNMSVKTGLSGDVDNPLSTEDLVLTLEESKRLLLEKVHQHYHPKD